MSRRWGLLRLSVAFIASATLIVGLGLFSTRAMALLNDVPETGTPGLLHLSTDRDEEHDVQLSPGKPAYWQISANLADAEEGSLKLRMQKSGVLVDHDRGLRLAVDRCDERWTNVPASPVCASGDAHVLAVTPVDDHQELTPAFDLGGIDSLNGKHLLITLSVEDSAAAATDATLMGSGYDVAFQLTAAGVLAADPVSTATPTPGTPQGSLPLTGIDATALALIAAGTLGLGAVLSSSRFIARRNGARA